MLQSESAVADKFVQVGSTNIASDSQVYTRDKLDMTNSKVMTTLQV